MLPAQKKEDDKGDNSERERSHGDEDKRCGFDRFDTLSEVNKIAFEFRKTRKMTFKSQKIHNFFLTHTSHPYKRLCLLLRRAFAPSCLAKSSYLVSKETSSIISNQIFIILKCIIFITTIIIVIITIIIIVIITI